MTDDRYDMRPVGRVDHETVDEMGLEAVLALKRGLVSSDDLS